MDKHVTISLSDLLGTRYAEVLGYPEKDSKIQEDRVEELKKLKVSDLEFYGKQCHFDSGILGKGCVGIVVVGHLGGKRVAVKIRRVDADRNIMQREAKLLETANSVFVGPRLYAVSDNFLLMQLIDGCPILNWLEKKLDITIVKKVLSDVLEQCWRLDQIGMDHGELSHAPKHIMVHRNMRAFILDFETASVDRKTANVTSTCHFLFISELVIKDTLGRKLGIDQWKLIEVLKRYKRAKTREIFEEILRVCSLQTM